MGTGGLRASHPKLPREVPSHLREDGPPNVDLGPEQAVIEAAQDAPDHERFGAVASGERGDALDEAAVRAHDLRADRLARRFWQEGGAGCWSWPGQARALD